MTDDEKKKKTASDRISNQICCIIPIIIILAIAFFVYNSYSASQYDNECLLKINASILEYNKTKPLSEKSDQIPIKGKVMIARLNSDNYLHKKGGDELDNYRSIDNLTDHFSPNENITLFIIIKTEETAGGTAKTRSGFITEGTATNYALTHDIIVIYWPEMKIAGWNTIQGEYAEEGDIAVGGEASGDNSIDDWIKSMQ